MGQRSSVEQLPDEVLKGVNAKLEAGYRLDEIVRWLSELGHESDVSRSALGRYKIKHEAVSGALRQSRIVAEAIAREAGSEDDGKISRVGVEMLHSIIMKMMSQQMTGNVPSLDPQELHYMARALKDSNAALEIDDKRVAKIKAEAKKAALDAASKEGVKFAKKHGLGKEAADDFRKSILKLED